MTGSAPPMFPLRFSGLVWCRGFLGWFGLSGFGIFVMLGAEDPVAAYSAIVAAAGAE